MRFLLTLLLALALAPAGLAQDERHVASPDGHIEFRVFVSPQDSTGLLRLAYEISLQGKLLIGRSYLGLDIWNQDPLLGENAGLIASNTGSGPGYNSLVAEYMQNGSIGRRINVEVRAFNDGVAFRYVLPHTTPLEDLLIADEATEYRFAHGGEALRGIGEAASLPLIIAQPSAAQPDAAYLAITEVRPPGFPSMSLARLDESTLVSRLPPKPNNPELAFEGVTPWTGPWRVVIIGRDRNRLPAAPMLQNLKP